MGFEVKPEFSGLIKLGVVEGRLYGLTCWSQFRGVGQVAPLARMRRAAKGASRNSRKRHLFVLAAMCLLSWQQNRINHMDHAI